MIIQVDEAVSLIRSGEIVAFPTETVYGLGADARNISAVKKTFEVKGRPPDNPLIVHISKLAQLDDLVASLPEDFHPLAKTFWPGPLTFVLNKTDRVPDVVTGGLPTVAVRMPDHPVALALIEQTGPLTAPSANRSGKPSPTRAVHVLYDYKGEIPVLDGGSTQVGLESTVLDLSGKQAAILRPGAISASMLEEITGRPVIENPGAAGTSISKSPGTRYTHYKPEASIQWMESIPGQFDENSYYLLHSDLELPDQKNIFCYHGDFTAMARDLYDHFRTADHLKISHIFIEKLPDNDVHRMISPLRNRIEKAAG